MHDFYVLLCVSFFFLGPFFNPLCHWISFLNTHVDCHFDRYYVNLSTINTIFFSFFFFILSSFRFIFQLSKKKKKKEKRNKQYSSLFHRHQRIATIDLFHDGLRIRKKKYIYSSPPTLNRVFIKVLISGTIKGPKSGSKWTMTLASPLAFVVPLPFSIVHRQKISSSTLYFTILPQGMTFRPCCLDSSQARLSDILMRWDLAGSQCKCHSVSLYPYHRASSLPTLSSPTLLFVPRSVSATVASATQILVIAKLQFVLIRMLQNRIYPEDGSLVERFCWSTRGSHERRVG